MHAAARRLQHGDGRAQVVGLEPAVEGVRQEHHVLPGPGVVRGLVVPEAARVVGLCVPYAQRSLRILRDFFDVAESTDMLQMRIHGDRESYLEEMGERRLEWSAGYYLRIPA